MKICIVLFTYKPVIGYVTHRLIPIEDRTAAAQALMELCHSAKAYEWSDMTEKYALLHLTAALDTPDKYGLRAGNSHGIVIFKQED